MNFLHSMPKASKKIKFKRKVFGKFFVSRKKLFYLKRNFMCREFFSMLYFIFLINEEEFRKTIKQILMKIY